MPKRMVCLFGFVIGSACLVLRWNWYQLDFANKHWQISSRISPYPPQLAKHRSFNITNDIMVPIKPSHIGDPNKTMVFYNRLSKCGSTTINNLVKTLPNHSILSTGSQRIWFRNNQNRTRVCRFIKKRLKAITEAGIKYKFITTHTAFLDPRDCGLPLSTLIYMNQFRHPITRFISDFYYSRRKSNSTEMTTIKNIVHFRQRKQNHFYAINQLCGFDDICTTLSPQVLQRAKSNAESFYPVIGILEDLEISLKLYEHFLPQIFSGAHEYYLNQSRQKLNNNSHPEPTERELELLASHLKLDIEFYEYLRRRLHRQAIIVGMDGPII